MGRTSWTQYRIEVNWSAKCLRPASVLQAGDWKGEQSRAVAEGCWAVARAAAHA